MKYSLLYHIVWSNSSIFFQFLVGFYCSILKMTTEVVSSTQLSDDDSDDGGELALQNPPQMQVSLNISSSSLYNFGIHNLDNV